MHRARKRTTGCGPKRQVGPWRTARAALAAVFVVAGAAKLVAPVAVLPGLPAWARVLLSLTEIGGGLLLLVPGLASLAAGVLVAASGAVVLGGLGDVCAPVPWPALVLVPALTVVGCGCRPAVLARVRLERALDRFMDSQRVGKKGDDRG